MVCLLSRRRPHGNERRTGHVFRAATVCSFTTVTGNVIHNIHVRQLFTGAEMAGIKFHGAIDTTISHNRIYRTCRGIWLDWMAQGARLWQTGRLQINETSK